MSANAKGVLFYTGVFFLTVFVFAESAGVVAQRQRSRRSAAQTKERVADLFRESCARCHGVDGVGDTALGKRFDAPDFTDHEWWEKHANITSDRALNQIVEHGKGGMPAFGKKLTRPEIKLLVNYVRRFRNQIK